MHTQSVQLHPSKKCKECDAWKPTDRFYDRCMRCKKCYDAFWMRKNDRRALQPLEISVRHAVARANRRSRYRRSVGGDLSVESALSLWVACRGKCCNCQTPMTFRWAPRFTIRNSAILDRVDTSTNRSYAGNCQWLCNDCNTEKGGWDLAAQKDAEIKRLRRELTRRPPPPPEIMYESILMR